MLYRAWGETAPRNTKDLDLLCEGDASVADLRQVFQDLTVSPVDEPDGLVFDANSVEAEEITEHTEYQGVRVRMWARLDSAEIRLQVDVGVGDAVFPPPQISAFSTLIDLPAPEIRMYPRETVVAEKFHAVTILGLGNSRMKDFFDLWYMAQRYAFVGAALAEAVKITFERRRTPIPLQPPPALTAEFWDDRARQAAWNAFLRKTEALVPDGFTLETAARTASDLVMPVTRDPRPISWPPGGPWQGVSDARLHRAQTRGDD